MTDPDPEYPPGFDAVREAFGGPIRSVERLSTGMSGAVWRVATGDSTQIVKRTTGPREPAVYRDLARALAHAGVRIPSCRAIVPNADGSTWLVLEDIPRPLPRDRWLADPDVLNTLVRLHTMDPIVLRPILEPYRPQWTRAMTDDIVALEGSAPLHGWLEAVREEHAALATVRRVISGDANPTNWGIDRDGAIVLMDWERIGLGPPAFDLATTIPGAGSADDFRLVSSRANEIRRSAPVEPEPPDLSPRALAVMKLFTIVELICGDGSADPDDAESARRRDDTARAVLGLVSQVLTTIDQLAWRRTARRAWPRTGHRPVGR